MVSLVSGFWKLQWSIAGICERDSYSMDCFFLSGKGVALEGQLRFIYHPELDGLCIAFIAVDFELDLGLVDEEHLQGIQQSSRHYFWKIFCTDRCQYLLVSATSSTVFLFLALKVWRSSSWMWSIVCIGGMNVMSKGGVEVCIL